MSFNFGSNNINQFKAQSAYKDASGMGGGGMYMRQEKKGKKDEEQEDLFQYNDENDNSDFPFGSDITEKDIPQDTLFNKFVNWFRLKKNN